jgi:hypothetical protein
VAATSFGSGSRNDKKELGIKQDITKTIDVLDAEQTLSKVAADERRASDRVVLFVLLPLGYMKTTQSKLLKSYSTCEQIGNQHSFPPSEFRKTHLKQVAYQTKKDHTPSNPKSKPIFRSISHRACSIVNI